jgi:hypothetical protein
VAAAALAPLALAAWMLWGAVNHMPEGDNPAAHTWTGPGFANVGWLGVASLVGIAFLAWRRPQQRLALLEGLAIAGPVLAGAAGATIGFAFEAERHNNWDAYPFASLLWTMEIGSISALLAAFWAARRGSPLASAILGPAAAVALVALLVWAWTWSPQVHALEVEIARRLWLATHG